MIPTFVDILRGEISRMQALHPDRVGELARAHAAIIEGHVRDDGDGVGRVLSRNGNTWYTVNGQCTCPAAEFGKPCRHLQAWKCYQHVHKKWREVWDEAHPPEPEPHAEDADTVRQIPARWLTTVQGVRCIKYVGLLHLAHAQGLTSLTATYTHNEAELSLAHAVAVFADGRRFEDSGDSTPKNAVRVKEHWRRMSLTRAKARALRDALALELCSVEELE